MTDRVHRMESLLAGFEPDFNFEPAGRIPEAEFADRVEKLRREATVAGHDALLIHADSAGKLSPTNGFLHYTCDWNREGVLVVPTDSDRELVLFSFFTETVLLPPSGEPVGVDSIWQISPVGREFDGRPGTPLAKTVAACARFLTDLGFADGSFGVIGDATTAKYMAGLKALLPRARFLDDSSVMRRIQRTRSMNELAQIRTAAQLADIGYQAACYVTRPGVTDHEIYAAFTYAQLARGGESGDSYQIGVNQWGTHCGKPYGHVIRSGDLINLYISAVTYHGYSAQIARMIAVGDITDDQEETLAMCTEAVRRAEVLIRPGVAFKDLHSAAFSAYVERGRLVDDRTSTMPYNWAAMEDGRPRRIPEGYVPDTDYESQGRRLNHVYPALAGPHNPNLGHAVGTQGIPKFNVTSHNTDRAEEGMVFVLHAQWLDPMKSGANIGDCYYVTESGYENLSRHSSLDTYRVKV